MIVKTAQLAEKAKVSPRMVRGYVAMGMPRKAPGRFDLERCLRWIRENVPPTGHGGKRSAVDEDQGDREGDAATIREMKGRQLETKIRREEIELGAIEGKYIEKTATLQAVSQHLTVVRQAVERMVGPAAADVAAAFELPAAKVPIVRSLLAARVREVLAWIARNPLPDELKAPAEPPAAPVPPAPSPLPPSPPPRAQARKKSEGR